MDSAALTDVGERLDAFVDEVFSSLKRKDQRATAGVYARGLMLDGRRKSMQPMADRLGIDHQRLQQFVTTSPWDPVPVRKTLSRKACDLIAPDAWVIDDTGFAKDGDASPCVAR
ncbi:transposase, partial [Rhodococcus sp. IITD102]